MAQAFLKLLCAGEAGSRRMRRDHGARDDGAVPFIAVAAFRLCIAVALTVPGATSATAASPPRPVSLEEALHIALEKSPDLEAAASRIAAARGAIVQAQSAFFPTLTIQESYAASNDPVQAFMMTLKQRAFDIAAADFNHPGTVDNLGTRVIGRWPLYNGGRNLAAREAARIRAAAAEDELAAARNTLVFEVTRAYFETIKARRFVVSAEAQVSDLQTSRALAANRHEEGAALETDVLDADVRLSLAREELVRAQNALAVAGAVLSTVVGAGDPDALTAAEPPGNIDALPQTAPAPPASHERPELTAARKAVAQADEEVRIARGGRLPRINAFAGYDVDSGDLEDFAGSWSAGVDVELDLFDGARTTGAVATAMAARDAARAELRRVELDIALELRRAELGIDETRARITTTASAIQQAQRSLVTTRERYRQGLALFAQVLDAETLLTAARQRRDAALLDHRVALAALDKARGIPAVTQPRDTGSASTAGRNEGKR